MANSKTELQLLRALLKRELNIDLSEPSEVDKMGENDVHKAIKDLFGDQFASTVAPNQPSTKTTTVVKKEPSPKSNTSVKANHKKTKKKPKQTTRTPAKPHIVARKKPTGKARPKTRENPQKPESYSQLIRTANGMAVSWARRVGNPFVHFVEIYEGNIAYGVTQLSNALQTHFSLLPLPIKMIEELKLTTRSKELSIIYKWALAMAEKTHEDAKAKYAELSKLYPGHDLEFRKKADGFVVVDRLYLVEHDFPIPEQVRAILNR